MDAGAGRMGAPAPTDFRRARRHLAAVAAIIVGLGVSPVAARGCVGDCNGDGTVTVNELITGVNIALGEAAAGACTTLDVNGDGGVSVNELIAAVNSALSGCATPTATPGSRFVDQGNGTIRDTRTGLIWEKKVGLGGGVDAANLHAADNLYSWVGSCSLLAGSDPCQPSAAAASACEKGGLGNSFGCAQCTRAEDSCETVGLTTIWDWIVRLNAGSGFAGHHDWRVPTATELQSLFDYSVTDPATDIAFNGRQCGAECTDLKNPECACTQPYYYWSASTDAYEPPDHVYALFFGNGAVEPIPFLADFAVRAVRGGSPSPMPRYVDNGDGTITDRETNLIWEKKVGYLPGENAGDLHSVGNPYSWAGRCLLATTILCQPNAAAKEACANGTGGEPIGCSQCQADQGPCELGSDGFVLTTIWDWVTQLNAGSGFAGQRDWRVPTIAELESIIDYTAVDPATDAAFAGESCVTGPGCEDITSAACSCTDSDYYWSATSPWEVDFGEAGVGSSGRSLRAGLVVRAVRGGS